MEAYDLAHKLAYAGKRCPVPFTTGPEYINGVPAVPVASMLRIFIRPEDWSQENMMIVAREIARVLGPTEQYDVGMTQAQHAYDPSAPASGITARLMKLDRSDPRIVLRVHDRLGEQVYVGRFPKLQFEPDGEGYWQSIYAPGAIKTASQP